MYFWEKNIWQWRLIFIHLLYLCVHRYIPNRASSSQMEAIYHLMHANTNTIAKKKQESNIHNINNNINHDNHTNYHNFEPASNASVCDKRGDELKRRVLIETCNGIPVKTKILNLHNKASDISDQIYSENIKMLYASRLVNSAKKIFRCNIPNTPDRKLDATGFRDDYCELNTYSYLYCI